nr:probable leucine-rich repeat receptor-like protein kinase At5g63930 [Tanacetum cinerariifolium]
MQALPKLLADDIVYSVLKVSAALGYMAPEYLTTGKFMKKNDVYAFGVVVLRMRSELDLEFIGRNRCRPDVFLLLFISELIIGPRFAPWDSGLYNGVTSSSRYLTYLGLQELFGVESPSEESPCSFPLRALCCCLPSVGYRLGLPDVVHLDHLHLDDKFEPFVSSVVVIGAAVVVIVVVIVAAVVVIVVVIVAAVVVVVVVAVVVESLFNKKEDANHQMVKKRAKVKYKTLAESKLQLRHADIGDDATYKEGKDGTA